MAERSTTPYIVNVSMPNNNTEYSAVIPAHAKDVRFHVRDSSAFLYYSFVKGDVASSRVQSMTIGSGEWRDYDCVLQQATTIYVASDKINNTFELEYWI